jgi:hypothetical protein
METVFCDRKGVLVVDFMQRGTTITSEVYCDIKKLRRAILNKRPGMLTSCVVLLHDNERPHTATRTQVLLEHFNWELFNHPPYSTDLALRDYLKNWLKSQRFSSNELMEGVKTWLNS